MKISSPPELSDSTSLTGGGTVPSEVGTARAAMTLTTEEIKSLAQMAGLRVEGELTDDEKETEITITDWPKNGVKSDDGNLLPPHKRIAYYDEYPEEGVVPLGSPVKP